MRYSHLVCQRVILVLREFVLIDDDGIVKIAALDKSSLDKREKFTNENERPGRRNVAYEVIRIIEFSLLACQPRRVEGDHHLERRLLIRDGDKEFAVRPLDLNPSVRNDKIVLLSILLLKTDLLDCVDEHDGTTVHDRHLRTVEFYEDIVDTAGIECSHRMFNCTDFGIAISNDRTALSLNDIIRKTVNDRLTFEIHSLNLVSVVHWCRTELRMDKPSCMKSHALKLERGLKRYLSRHNDYFSFSALRASTCFWSSLTCLNRSGKFLKAAVLRANFSCSKAG